jgi:hypothetical protein
MAVARSRAAEAALLGKATITHSSNVDRMLPLHLSPPGGWIAVVSKLLERLLCNLTMHGGTAELIAMDDRLPANIGT